MNRVYSESGIYLLFPQFIFLGKTLYIPRAVCRLAYIVMRRLSIIEFSSHFLPCSSLTCIPQSSPMVSTHLKSVRDLMVCTFPNLCVTRKRVMVSLRLVSR